MTVTTRSIIREMEPEELKERYYILKSETGLTRFARLQRDVELNLIAKNYFEIVGENIEE